MSTDRLKYAKLFEYVVAVLLLRNGYRAGVPQRYLQGRGTKHQIDVLAIDPLPMPFVFPTRILCEAKCYSQIGERSIGVSYVRNLFAEATDLQQTLPRQKKLTLEPLSEEPVSCVYAGALFSTIAFSKPAIEFANSYAISLVPLSSEIEKTYLPKLMQKLADFVDGCAQLPGPKTRINGCPHNCFDGLPFDTELIQETLQTAGLDILALRSPKERRVFVYALNAMLRKCPKLKEMNESLLIHRVASIGNMLVLVRITEDDFRNLARDLAKLFLGRSEDGFANLAIPTLSSEGEQTSIYGPAPSSEIIRREQPEHPPPGFEWFALRVLGVTIDVLALSGTVRGLNGARKPSYFTLKLDFGLTLHSKVHVNKVEA